MSLFIWPVRRWASIVMSALSSLTSMKRQLTLEREKLRAAAELAQLRAHLEPHFLLNTLNAIAGLVTANPSEARNLLVYLGDLLRGLLKDQAELHRPDRRGVTTR